MVMKLSEFAETEKIESAMTGLPQGDTFLKLEELDVDSVTTSDGNKRYKLTEGDKTYYVPPSVMEKIVEAQKEGLAEVRVTRSGTGKTDTNYTVVGVDKKK